jgi:hypothetical protein
VQKKNIAILAAALALASPLAGAQAIWRCGSSYSEQPCPGGTPVGAAPRVTPAESAAATRVANADARLAAEMERARLAQERNAPKAIVIGPQAPASAPVANKDGTKPKAGKLEQFTAVSRAPGEKKKKHKRKKAA